MVVCNTLEHKQNLLQEGKLMDGVVINKIEDWSPRSHWDQRKIMLQDEWVKIEGLLYNMWNGVAFQMIRDCLVALLQVGKATVNKENLRVVFITVQGSSIRFFDSVPKIPYWGETVQLAILWPSNEEVVELEFETEEVGKDEGDNHWNEGVGEESSKGESILQEVNVDTIMQTEGDMIDYDQLEEMVMLEIDRQNGRPEEINQ
ncbi:hypothetical protein Scep_001821 [Stephania cephalantha]|uniref:DUF4283 domain-containing protein n=1 Tax=Stephania cephalantha TaxID=152367 RepID=A0AAP0Q443_9MAGN